MKILTDKTTYFYSVHWSSDLFCIQLSTAFKHMLEILQRIILFSLSWNCNASFWVAETDRGSVTIFNRGKIGSASVMILSHHRHQSPAGSQTMYARWVTCQFQAGHWQYVCEPQPVPQRSMKRRRGKSIPNCFWAVYFSADFDRVKKILLALGRADFTLNIFNVFIQTGLRHEKIIQKDTEAHQEQLLSEKS